MTSLSAKPFMLAKSFSRYAFRCSMLLIIGVLVALLFSGLLPQAWAQDIYPAKQIRLVIPFPPGGGTDFVARTISQALGEKVGQPIVVEYIPGANGNIGAARVARSPADGYTLLLSYTGTQSINPSLYKNVGYDPVNGLEPIAMISKYSFVLVTNPRIGVSDVAGLIKYAHEKKARLNYGSAGIGSGGQLLAELFKSKYRVNMTGVPYRGSGPMITDLIGGQIDLAFDGISNTGQFIRNGRLTALAVTGDSKIPGYPNIPTMAEQGYPDMTRFGWYGLFAPKGTPNAILTFLSNQLAAVLSTEDMRNKFAGVGHTVTPHMRGDKFKSFLRSDKAAWGQLVKQSGITLE